MSFTGPPGIPITPVPMRKGVASVHRNLSFLPPFTSTPISRVPVKAAKNGDVDKGKATVASRQQTEIAAIKPLKCQNQKASEAVLSLQSKVLAIRNGLPGAKPATSEMKNPVEDANTIPAAVKKLIVIGKAVSTGIEKTAAMSRGDAQRKLGGQFVNKASLATESKEIGKEKTRSGLRSGSTNAKPQDKTTKVASEPRENTAKGDCGDENTPNETNQNIDPHVLQLSKCNSLNHLQGKHSESVHKVTEASSKSTDSSQNSSGRSNKATRTALTLRPVGSKGLLPKDVNSDRGSAQVTPDLDLRAAKTDSAVHRNPTERKSSFKAPNPKHLETNENNMNRKSTSRTKLAQTTTSTNVVKITAHKSSGCIANFSTAEKIQVSAASQNSTNVIKTTTHKSSVHADNVSTAGKKRVSVSAVPRVQIPRGKTSAMINSEAEASRVYAFQSTNSERLASEVSNSDSTQSKGYDRETLTGSIESRPVKTRARKRVAPAEISVDLERSTDVSVGADRPKAKRKKLKVVEDEVGSTQPERRFLKRKIAEPKKLLPNSSQEKAIKRAQNFSRRKSMEQQDIELKVQPNIYRRWKVASKPTVEFAVGTVTQTFEEKFDSQKVDLVSLVKSFEELKARLTSAVSLVKVPTSRQPVNYLAFTTQEEALKKHLDESSMDVEQIDNTMRNCEESNEKLKILKERFQSKHTRTSDAERLYEAVLEQSTVESILTTEQSNVSETEK